MEKFINLYVILTLAAEGGRDEGRNSAYSELDSEQKKMVQFFASGLPNSCNYRLRSAVKAELTEWINNELNWDNIEKQHEGETYTDEEGRQYQSAFIGSVMSLAPSGKYYTPWTTNQTRLEEIKDACFFEALADAVEKKGCFLQSGESDPTDIFIIRLDDQ